MTSPDKIGVLTRTETKEVSLVDVPANMRPFAILKSKGETMDELIENVLTVEVDGEEVVEKSEGTSDKGKAALVSAFRILKGFKDEYSEEALVETLKAAGVVINEPAPVAEEPEVKEEVVKAEELPEEVQLLFKAQQEAIAKRDERLAEVEKKLAQAEEEKAVAAFTKKAAEEYAELGDPKEVGAVLKAVSGQDIEGALSTLLKAANEKIAKGGLFEEIATPHEPSAEGVQDAHAELTQKAKEFVAAGTVKTEADGLILAMKRHPELVEKSRA